MLALARAREQGIRVGWLLNFHDAATRRVRFHGVPVALIARQAASLALPLLPVATAPDRYEDEFMIALDRLRSAGARGVVFGNIHLADVRAWYEERVRLMGLEHVEPLWGEAPAQIVGDFIGRGFRTMVTSVDLERGDAAWLGRTLDASILAEMIAHGIDPAGERGEYHTFTYAGPDFSQPVRYHVAGTVEARGHRMLDLRGGVAGADQ